MPKFTEKRYSCRRCRQQVMVRFERQQAIVSNPNACTRECAFGLMIVGAKDVVDQEMFEIMKHCDRESIKDSISEDV
ncbi:MAG: hypothetical protein ACFB2X_08560 [Rivularia sp. (in: cyanobacteria)]